MKRGKLTDDTLEKAICFYAKGKRPRERSGLRVSGVRSLLTGACDLEFDDAEFYEALARVTGPSEEFDIDASSMDEAGRPQVFYENGRRSSCD